MSPLKASPKKLYLHRRQAIKIWQKLGYVSVELNLEPYGTRRYLGLGTRAAESLISIPLRWILSPEKEREREREGQKEGGAEEVSGRTDGRTEGRWTESDGKINRVAGKTWKEAVPPWGELQRKKQSQAQSQVSLQLQTQAYLTWLT